jgi:uncharacterized membrane protein
MSRRDVTRMGRGDGDHRGRRSLLPAVLVGVGLGGFFDGIVLHQILQWHHLVSTRMPVTDLRSLEANTLADGVFHQVMWLLTVVGVVLLAREWGGVRAGSPLGLLAGGALVGWGLFNIADSVVFHVLLELHHIRPGPDQVLYDVGFLAWGLLMLAAGAWLVRGARRSKERLGTR